MDNSPFKKLPGEVRNQIYGYFFDKHLSDKIQVDIRHKDGARIKTNKQKARTALAFIAICREVRHESLALFWSKISLRIVADTLTAYSYKSKLLGVGAKNAISQVSETQELTQQQRWPMLCSVNANWHSAETLKQWIADSGIMKFAHFLRPIDLDMGVWDPRENEGLHQLFMLGYLKTDTKRLTTALRPLLAAMQKTEANEFKLFFNILVTPATALGTVRVPNDPDKARAVVRAHCAKRFEDIEEMWEKGLLTDFGRRMLRRDVFPCRSVAVLLVKSILESEEDRED